MRTARSDELSVDVPQRSEPETFPASLARIFSDCAQGSTQRAIQAELRSAGET
jgi:hypothetical protein